MKKTLLALLCACALLAVGCFFGGADDTTGPAVPDKKDTVVKTPSVKLITPGLYVGDYTWIDSNQHGLESEFVLDPSGNYRLFWVSDNEAVYDQHGNWYQKDSSFYFSKSSETWAQSGFLDGWKDIEDDTNSVRNVTDTSFIRREWTPLRQKPYWISYHIKPSPKLLLGTYSITKTYPKDSVSNEDVRFKYDLTDQFVTFTVDEDTLGSTFERTAKWSQMGSFLALQTIQQRGYDDSTKTLSAAWDTLSSTGMVLYRTQGITDTIFNIWNPASLYDTASWDPYRKSK